jgi:hypothetical protein
MIHAYEEWGQGKVKTDGKGGEPTRLTFHDVSDI